MTSPHLQRDAAPSVPVIAPRGGADETDATHDENRTVVIIEDDDDLRDVLTLTFAQQGFVAYAFADGAEGVEAVRTHAPLITTVDIQLDGIDGYEVVRRIREFHDGYVIMITALDEETATVEGFRCGADEYITKPWRRFELRARIDALMRRPRGIRSDAPDDAWLEVDALRVHAASRRVELGDVELDLTKSEFDVLHALAARAGIVVEKSWIALMLRRQNGVPGEHVNHHDLHAVEVHMMNLRRKLGDDARSGRLIETVRGLGYRLTPRAA